VLVLVARKVSLTASQYAIAIAGVCNETENRLLLLVTESNWLLFEQ